ncbi:MAG: hypothetical protein IJC45_06120 [Clostridia bacterium]|nr:hypothetical protein [Clostridia bacterium]
MKNARGFVLFCCVLCLGFACSCAQQDEVPTTEKVENTTTVNNIYITDNGIFTDAQVQYATQVPQTQPAVSATQQPTSAVTQPMPTEVATTAPSISEYSPQMILDVITQSVNSAKQASDFTAHQLQEVTINLTDCTFSWAVPVINTAIGVFNGPHHFDYTFVDGTCLDPKEDFKTSVTPNGAIPPSDRLFALDVSGVTDYKAYEENGEYVFTVTLPPEQTGADNPVPYYHAQAMDYLDLGDFDFGIGEITDSQCNYPGATVTVRLDKNGTLLKYEETIPMNGSGTGKLGISLSASFEGYMYESWTFEW